MRFTVGVTVITVILAGLAPALFAIKQAFAFKVPGRRQPLHGGLVVAEIAAAMVLLVGSFALSRLAGEDPGSS